jgi:hypothetical protein
MVVLHSWRGQCRTVITVTALFLCASALTGCHTHKHIPIASSPDLFATPAPSTALQNGDDVRIILRNGDEVRFTVAEVQADALVGNTGRRVLYSDMQSLERRQLSKAKTGVMFGVLAFWVVMMIGAAINGVTFGG